MMHGVRCTDEGLSGRWNEARCLEGPDSPKNMCDAGPGSEKLWKLSAKNSNEQKNAAFEYFFEYFWALLSVKLG